MPTTSIDTSGATWLEDRHDPHGIAPRTRMLLSVTRGGDGGTVECYLDLEGAGGDGLARTVAHGRDDALPTTVLTTTPPMRHPLTRVLSRTVRVSSGTLRAADASALLPVLDAPPEGADTDLPPEREDAEPGQWLHGTRTTLEPITEIAALITGL